jgi:type II secretory pathway predicted ATPase ExeA
MFLRFYGLREQPFGMTPDYRFLYLGASHREALASLIYGIEAGRGFVGLIAEPGMGKTTVLFQFMERLRNSARTAFLFQTQGSTREFLSNLIADLGLDPTGQDVASLQRQLNEILIQEAQMGRQFVLVIDEAQNLDDSVLESVRMLSNFETPRSKLIQIVLAGQPPLADKLARPEFEQLRQRVSILCRLEPFSREEVADYIRHRLETAGYDGGPLFTPEALAMIAERSEGIPRNINNLCFHALSLGYAKGRKRIDGEIINEVLCDLELETLRTSRPNSQVQKPENQVPAAVTRLEDVTLNSGPRRDTGRVLFRSVGQFSPPERRVRARGGRHAKNGTPAWLTWAVALLTLVLAGEVFWAYLPSGPSRQPSSQNMAGDTDQPGGIAGKNDLADPNRPADSAGSGAAVLNSDANLNAPTNQQASGSMDQEDVDGSSRGESGSAPSSSEESDPSAQDSGTTPSTTSRPVADRTGRGSRESGLTDGSQGSEQVPKGKIVIQSNIPGSAITINGRSGSGWYTPRIFNLPAGTYRISVSQDGYSTWFRDVQVTPGDEKWINADLHPPQGVIVIDTDPPGMQVFIDGRAYGPSEVEASLNPGSHTYRVIPPGGRQPFEGSFVLKPGDIVTRKIRWLPSGSQPSATNRSDAGELRDGGKKPDGREQS